MPFNCSGQYVEIVWWMWRSLVLSRVTGNAGYVLSHVERDGIQLSSGEGRVQMLQHLAESRCGLLVQAQSWRLSRPKLKFGIDNILPVTSSQSLNLSNLTLWFAFLFKVGVIVLAAALSGVLGLWVKFS